MILRAASARLFKTFTLEFEFDRHLEHMFGHQGMQTGCPVFLAGDFEIFCENDFLKKPDFSCFSNHKNKKIDHIWTEYDHILPFTNHKSALLRFWLTYKAYKVDIVDKETPLNHLLIFNFSKNKANHM